jgi:peptidoglycan/LPS O-acetylase OafA/YrhL
MTNDRLDDLTGARFFAALGVIVFHLAALSPWLFTPAAYKWVPYGKTCVSFFFTLSGFVLAYTYLGWFRQGVRRADYGRFLRNRIARIVPAHAAVLVLMIPLIAATRLSDDWTLQNYGAAGTALRLAWTWLVNLLLVQIYVPSFDAASWWNVPAWSIDCEAFFYAVFPFLAWGISRWLTTPERLVMAGIAAYGLEVAGLQIAAWQIGTFGPPWTWDRAFTLDFLAHLPHLRLWEFLIGCLAGAYVRARRDSGQADWLGESVTRNLTLSAALVGCVAIMAGPGVDDPATISKTTLGWYVLFTPAFTLIILALASGRTWLSGLLSHPWLLRLGEASYALYLIHWPLLVIDRALKDNGLDRWRIGFDGNVLLCIGLALLLHRWVETPARKRLRAPDTEVRLPKPAGSGETGAPVLE